MITLKKTSACFFRNQIVFVILKTLLIKANFDWWKTFYLLMQNIFNYIKIEYTKLVY